MSSNVLTPPVFIPDPSNVLPVSDENHFISMLQHLKLEDGNISNRTAAKKYQEIELVYKATVTTFNKVLVAQDMTDEEKRNYLTSLKSMLDRLSVFLANGHRARSDTFNATYWEEQNDAINAMDIDYLLTSPQTIAQAESVLDRISAPIIGFGKSLLGFVTHPVDTARSVMGAGNWWRTFYLRVSDLFTAAASYVDNRSLSQANSVLGVIGKTFSILGIFIYTTRFLINSAMLLKHTLGLGIEDEEREFSWRERLKMQWDQRKYEMMNDLVWASIGIASFAFLSATVGPFVAAAFYGFDVANAGYQLHQKNKQYHRILEDVAVKQYDPLTTESDRKILKLQQESLENEVRHERRSLGLSVGVTSALLAGVVPTVVAASVANIPLIGAALLVGVMVVEKICSTLFGWMAPKHDLPKSGVAQPEPVPAAESGPELRFKESPTARPQYFRFEDTPELLHALPGPSPRFGSTGRIQSNSYLNFKQEASPEIKPVVVKPVEIQPVRPVKPTKVVTIDDLVENKTSAPVWNQKIEEFPHFLLKRPPHRKVQAAAATPEPPPRHIAVRA